MELEFDESLDKMSNMFIQEKREYHRKTKET
jgi:hypothetical protein